MAENLEMTRILERVKKMLTLAADAGATEGERDNALRMAHSTLAKYNLTLAEAEATHPGQSNDPRVDQSIETRSRPWILRTAHGVADLFFCKYFFVRSGRNAKHYFVGRLSNVTTAKEIAAYVINSINREGRARARDQLNPNPWRLSFCKGAAEAVRARCVQLRRDAEKASQAAPVASTGTSLVLASVYAHEVQANSDYLRDVLKINLRSSRSREKGAGDGYGDGHAFGSKVSLNRQVGTSKQARLS
jgi:hypothetical protein